MTLLGVCNLVIRKNPKFDTPKTLFPKLRSCKKWGTGECTRRFLYSNLGLVGSKETPGLWGARRLSPHPQNSRASTHNPPRSCAQGLLLTFRAFLLLPLPCQASKPGVYSLCLFLTAGNPLVRKTLSASGWGVTKLCEVWPNPQNQPGSCRGPCLGEKGLPQACQPLPRAVLFTLPS